MQFEKIIEISMLYDFYGQLLTGKQREIVAFYHEDNFSLAEIAKEVGISRQGVHDALKKSEKALQDYEDKLGLIQKFSQTEMAISEIDKAILELITENKSNDNLRMKLHNIKNIIDNLNE